MMMTRLSLIALMTTLGLHPAAACVLPPLTVQLDLPADLVGTDWQVDRLNGAAVSAQSAILLAFGAEGQAQGTGGCNGFSARYKALDGGVVFGPVGSTEMACAGGTMAAEAVYFQILADVTAYELSADGQSLGLISAAGNRIDLHLRF